VDSYRYYFLREIQFGQDGNFSWESMVERHNADLANGLGNLASRVLAMLGSYFDGAVPSPGPREAASDLREAASDLPEVVADVAARFQDLMGQVAPAQALSAAWDLVARANQYLVEREPWQLAKDPARREELAGVLYAAAETLRILAVLVSAAMPAAAERLWTQLGMTSPLDAARLPAAAAWGGLEPGTATKRGEALFPRLEG
jgi:methionyl-tRNA synthetase